MYQFFTASKDATIYQHLPTRNTGLDEILEVSKEIVGDTLEVSRFLIQFNTTEISSSIASGDITMSNAELILKECEAEEVPLSYTVYGYPVSSSWEMGIGTKYDDFTTDGVTWNHKSGSGVSASASLWDTAGGDFITSSVSTSALVEYIGYDLVFDVSSSLDTFIAGTLPNYGMIFKLSDVAETNDAEYGRLQFFSKETNTIYQPKIRIGWDDQVFNTGSLTSVPNEELRVTVKNLRKEYKVGSKPIIRVYGREKYPYKTYTNQYQYDDVQYLPQTTYYQIKDAVTDEVIIPYGEYTKVSCDANGNYIQLNLVNWETNRRYYFEFKVELSGSIEYYSNDNLAFKVDK